MSDSDADRKADILEPKDEGESIGLMEPMTLAEGALGSGPLRDLCLTLAEDSAGLRRSLPEPMVDALATLVRSMNCYYSNLIEGHDTHPVDIERALNDDYSTNPEKRNLQLEAKAHIAVQKWIDDGGIAERVTTPENLQEIHERFCALVPEELLWVTDPQSGKKEKVIPGAFRESYVQVGQHVSVSPGAVPRFLERFDGAYARLGKSQALLSTAAAHHRLLWIHPFSDGNGRVARLMTYAMLRETLDTGGLWSVARGFARQEVAYKQHLMACDQPRRGDRDGRGTLSEAALLGFTGFFLETCLDQVRFMTDLIEPDRLRQRISTWAAEEIAVGALPKKSALVLEAVLYRGELPRSSVGDLMDVGDRQGRRIVSALVDKGVLTSTGPRAPLRIAFPAALASRWMPGLFPEQ